MTTPAPSHVRVGPYALEVAVGGPAWDAQVEAHRSFHSPDDQLFGRCDFENLIIGVNGDVADDMIRETLLHEVLHACVFASGADLGEGAEHEEAFVAVMSPMLIEVLRNNPVLVDFLLRR